MTPGVSWKPLCYVEATMPVVYQQEGKSFVAWCPALNLFVTCDTLADLQVAAPAAVRECLSRRHARHLSDAEG